MDDVGGELRDGEHAKFGGALCTRRPGSERRRPRQLVEVSPLVLPHANGDHGSDDTPSAVVIRGYSASRRSSAARTADLGAVPANTRNRLVWSRSSSVSTAAVGPVVVPPPHAVAATNAEIAKSLRMSEGQPVSVKNSLINASSLAESLRVTHLISMSWLTATSRLVEVLSNVALPRVVEVVVHERRRNRARC